MRVYTGTLDKKTDAYAAATSTTQTSAAAWASPQEHDALLFETDITIASGSGTVTPSILFSPTFDGEYTTLFEGDVISGAGRTTQRKHLLDIHYVLTGFYKIVQTVSGTVSFSGSSTLFPARRAAS